MDNDTFFKLLNETMEDPTLEQVDKCYISDEPLNDTRVTLNCNHSFNYYALYQEIIKQKHSVRNKLNHLQNHCLECPYCRQIQTTLIPYRKIKGVRRIRGVNSPKEWCMSDLTKQCLVCSAPCARSFCCVGHDKLYNKCHCLVQSKKLKYEHQCHNKGIFMIEEKDKTLKLCGIHHNQYKKYGITKLNLFKK